MAIAICEQHRQEFGLIKNSFCRVMQKETRKQQEKKWEANTFLGKLSGQGQGKLEGLGNRHMETSLENACFPHERGLMILHKVVEIQNRGRGSSEGESRADRGSKDLSRSKMLHD